MRVNKEICCLYLINEARYFEGVTFTRHGTSLSRGTHSVSSDDVSQSGDHDRHGIDGYTSSTSGRGQQPRTPPHTPSPYHQHGSSNTRRNEPLSPIQELLLHPLLFDPVRRPRYPLVLCHGTCATLLGCPAHLSNVYVRKDSMASTFEVHRHSPSYRCIIGLTSCAF